MKEFDPKYKIGEIVFLRTDPDQLDRLVIGYHITAIGFKYILCCGECQTDHFHFEVTDSKNILFNLN